MAVNDELFPCVRVEGAILPTDLLQRVADGDRSLDGLRPEDYHLVSEQVNQATSNAWTRLTRVWDEFRPLLDKPASAADESTTLKKWLLPFWHALGYGQLDAVKPFEIDGKLYPISHLRSRSPIHLVGFRQDLDKRVEAGDGKRPSPHGMVQELLNRSDDHLWAFVSNGLKLRVLRDNIRLTRQAFVEFDLQAIFDGKAYADFALLWRLCHESRVKPEKVGGEGGPSDNPADCWLERWSKAAAELGLRALEQLREGVELAVEALGRGFLHPQNAELIRWLKEREPHAQEYYRQLLRVVYRLLFMFVAEDRVDGNGRSLLFAPSASDEVCTRYREYYSTARLRRIAEQTRGTPHTDLYQALELVQGPLGRGGCHHLGLLELGGLFDTAGTPNLNGCVIGNADLLEAVRALSVVSDGKSQRSVDYRNLGSEELGSVYESLLELHPQFTPEPASFKLKAVSGNARKTSGSYYTPTSLITCLLDSALDPLLDEAEKKPDAETAILNLKVCDPACGSGHFLIAAAHRIARRLAAVRTQEEPAPDAIRQALRDVIGRCVYGVDMNPMAVELCQVALWMEALEPGKPLSFLRHHVQCGNSLLGSAPALMARGIPDEAFKPVDGDDEAYCRVWRDRNREERRGQGRFTDAEPVTRDRDFAAELASLDSLPDTTPEQVRAKQQKYEELAAQTNYEASGQFLADLWCAAFVWRKTRAFEQPVTEAIFRRARQDPGTVPEWMYDEVAGCPGKGVAGLREQYRFFHWHLAFPGVFRVPADGKKPENTRTGWSGGFDLVLGNPPWDTLSPDAKEFFAAYDPQVRFVDKDGQKRIIEQLLTQPAIAAAWERNCRNLYAQVHLIKNGGRYRLFAPGNLGKGDFNVFRMFVETALETVRPAGWAAQIVPEGLYNGANSMAIRKALFETCELRQIYGFENTNEVWFKQVHTALKFCLYAAHLGGETASFRTAFNIKSHERLAEVQGGTILTMPVSLVREFSPDALAVMELGNQTDIDIAAKLYKWPKFGDTSVLPKRDYLREIDMGTDRDLFCEDREAVPLYEGRMVGQFDHRAKGYRSGRGRAAVWEDLAFSLPTKSLQPQWHIAREQIPEKAADRVGSFRVAFCDVASPTNERTLVAALIPPNTISGHSAPTCIFEPEGYEWCYPLWLSIANSFVTDFVARMKVSLHMSFTILDSIPFPRLPVEDPRTRLLVPLALRLTCTGPEMIPFWNIMAGQGWVDPVAVNGTPPGIVDEDERLVARAEIDAIVARDVFELTRPEVEYVLDTFPVHRGYQEQQYREYRSRRLILEVYDALKRASETGVPYQPRGLRPGSGSSSARTLSEVYAHGCPTAPFTVRLSDADVGAGQPSEWHSRPFTDREPTPPEGSWVIVKHDGLRRGSSTPGIAAGRLAFNPIAGGMEVLLKGAIPPAVLRLTTEQLQTFRPLAVLTPPDQPE